MNQAVSFQAAIEFIEALSEGEQDLLFDPKALAINDSKKVARNVENTIEEVRHETARGNTTRE